MSTFSAPCNPSAPWRLQRRAILRFEAGGAVQSSRRGVPGTVLLGPLGFGAVFRAVSIARVVQSLCVSLLSALLNSQRKVYGCAILR
eukprot:2479713-Pyramimonas_sp.AAC.1